jgi:hypothetical protein
MPLSRLPPKDTYSRYRIENAEFEPQKEVKAPRRRNGLPCFVKGICVTKFCKERTSDKCPLVAGINCHNPNCHECTRIICEKECERRKFKQEIISIEICRNSNCQKLIVDKKDVYFCSRFMAEVRVVNRKPFSRDPVIRQRGKVGQGFWYRKV